MIRPLLTLALCLALHCGARADDALVRLIFDTDLQGDVDDVGTVAMLHALADQGEVDLLAMGVSCKNPWSPLCLDALNTYFGRPDIPLGVVRGEAFLSPSKYARQIAEEFPHRLKSADDAPDAVQVYRKVLARAKDKSVVMLSVGQLTNLARLLKSPPDSLSELPGEQLVAAKVKAWVCMGCTFPTGREANIYHDVLPAKYAIEHWPTHVTFSGFEIGRRVMTGGRLKSLPPTSPVRRAYELFNGIKPHYSYDQTAALFAVRGLDGSLSNLWNLSTTGHCTVDSNGVNTWTTTPGPNDNHAYLIKKAPPEEVAAVIEALMMWQPEKQRPGDSRSIGLPPCAKTDQQNQPPHSTSLRLIRDSWKSWRSSRAPVS